VSGLAKNELPSAFVMAGLDHSRSKNGVASLAYAIPLRDAASPRSSKSEGGCPPDRDHRVKCSVRGDDRRLFGDMTDTFGVGQGSWDRRSMVAIWWDAKKMPN
jgi:hypothetical protein